MNRREARSGGAPRLLHTGLLCSQVSHEKQSLSQRLVEVLGQQSAEKIVREFGGARLWIPIRGTPDARLVQLLGHTAASALCARFGGDYLQVPNSIDRDHVQYLIAELHRQGCRINEIALAVGRSRRTVFRLLGRKITELQQPGDFASEMLTRVRDA